MPLAKCSSAVIVDAEGASERTVGDGRIVLAESLVPADAGVCPRVAASCGGEVRVRPRGASSEGRPASADGLLLVEGVWAVRPSLELSTLHFPVSMDGLAMQLIMLPASSGPVLAEELDGRVGGDGGAPRGCLCTLLEGTAGGSHWKFAVVWPSDGSERCITLP